jgi:hypothetical protein
MEALQQFPGRPDLLVLKSLKSHRHPAGNEAQDVAIMFVATEKVRRPIESHIREVYKQPRREEGRGPYGTPHGVSYSNNACGQPTAR